MKNGRYRKYALVLALAFTTALALDAQTKTRPGSSAAGYINGSGVASGQIAIVDGTAADPSIVFSSDDDGTGTGIYRVGANRFGFATNGKLKFSFNESNFWSYSTDGTQITAHHNGDDWKLQSDGVYAFSNSSTDASTTKDTGFSRIGPASVGVGNGTAADVSGTISLSSIVHNDGGTKPTCDSSTRGKTWYDQGGAGVADTFEICMKDSGDAYGWKVLATP